MNKHCSSRRAVLSRMILPAALVTTASAANITWDGSQNPFTLVSNPIFGEGLQESYTDTGDDETTPAASAIIGPDNGQGAGISLGLRMAQIFEGTPSGVGSTLWANPRTWIYAGEVFTGPNGIISFAANLDDTDYLKLDGAVVLNDNGWDTPKAVTVRGLEPNTWVSFEYRGSDTGAGGAGPSGQNTGGGSNWNQTTGAVMSYADEAASLNANSYIGGPNDLGKPTEVANGTPELFRFTSSGGGGGDTITVTASSTATLTGTATQINESVLQFQSGTTPVTLTFNNSDAVQRTLAAASTIFGNANGSTTIFSGSGHIRLGQTSDSTFTGVSVIKDGGTGDLIFDNPTNDLNGTTIKVVAGRVSIQGNGLNPVSSLATPIEINGPNARLRFGGRGIDPTPTTFSTSIAVNDSGTLEHASNRQDTISGTITIASGKTLNADITGGPLRVSGAVSGPSLTKTGIGLLRLDGTTLLDTVTVSAGTLALNGDTTLTNAPTIASGATLALTGAGTSYSFPGPLVVSTGATLQTYSAPIGTRQTNLTGGTLVLDGQHGLTGEFWNVAPSLAAVGDNSDYNPTWGPTTLTQGVGNPNGTNTPGAGDFTAFQNVYTGLGAPGFIVNSSAVGVSTFDFPSIAGAPYAVYGVTYVNNIQARWTGKIFAPVAGIYNLSTNSDDGSAVFVDGASVAYNNRYQGIGTIRGGTVFLQPGLHDIVIGFYEGGGDAGLQVFVTPPGGNSQLLNNAILFPSSTVPTFNNPVDVQQDSTIRTDYFGAVTSEVTIQAGRRLTTEGNPLTVTTVKMPASGAYTINTSGAPNTLVASRIDDNAGAAALTINKTGTGVFVLDNTTTAQLTNPATTININEGSLGILLQTGGLSPTGNAAINFNGGGIVLSSKGGDQTYAIPAAGFGGTSPVIEARQLGSGVAGPVNISLGGNLKVPSTQTLGLRTADGYTLSLGGTADISGGAGTVSINGGRINSTTNGAVAGLNVNFNAIGPAVLNFRSTTPAIASLSSSSTGAPVVSLGSGAGTTVLTINQAGNTTYRGTIVDETGSVGSVVKQGTGTLILAGNGSTFSGGIRIESGVVNALGNALGTGPVTLAGGILQAAPSGLLGEYWDSTVGGDGNAQAGFAGDLLTFNSYFAGKGAPVVSAPTTTAGRLNLKFSDGPGLEGGGPNTATFGDQGFAAVDNMAVRFSGTIFAPVAGDYTFTTRSDDGSVLFIDGVKVVTNNAYQPMVTVNSLPVTLTAGNHTISIGFYEGTQGSGLEVRYTPPGGADQFIPNTVLGGLHGTNAVNLTASSTIDPVGGTMDLGVLSMTPTFTLTGLAGNINFTSTVLTGAGGNTYTFDKSSGVLNLGSVANAGNPVIINKVGSGSLLFASATSPQLTNAGNQLNVNGGSAVVVGGAINPLGATTVNLNGGALILSTADPTATFATTVNVNGTGTLSAGNFGGGATDNNTVTFSQPLAVNSGNTVILSTTNGYTLNVGAVSGGGNINFVGGTVNANGAVTAGVVTVSPGPGAPPTILGGVLSANANFTATSIAIGNGGALRATGAVNATGGITLNATGELQTAGGTINAPINVTGGIIRAQSGVTDLSNTVVSFAPPSITNNAIRGVLHLTTGEFVNSVLPATSDAGILGTQLRSPQAAISLTGPVDIVNDGTSDAKFTTLFNTNAAGQRFTAGFFGRLTAPESGLYQFEATNVDDNAGFWVDLNRNGVFETLGSAGNELISNRDCCGAGVPGEATLVTGQTYNVAFAVEDTGGDSGLTANFKRPSDAGLLLVDPGAAGQANLWSANASTAGGGVIVEAGAELRASSLNNATVVALTGADAKLRVSSGNIVTDAIEGLSAIIGFGSATVELGANNTLNVGSLSVSPSATLIKTGAGTITAAAQSIGLGGTLRVDAGTVNLNGAASAFNGNTPGVANMGEVVVNGTGIVNVNGAISGAVTVNTGGTVRGTGTIGNLTVNADGNANPGIGAGTLKTGNLTFSAGANVVLELVNMTSLDQFNVTGTVTLNQSDLLLSLLDGYDIVAGNRYFIINNDDVDPVLGTFVGLADGSTVTAPFGAQFRIDYDGDFGTNANSGGNDVVLTALNSVPEPSALLALLGGSGMLIGLQRFRRV